MVLLLISTDCETCDPSSATTTTPTLVLYRLGGGHSGGPSSPALLCFRYRTRTLSFHEITPYFVYCTNAWKQSVQYISFSSTRQRCLPWSKLSLSYVIRQGCINLGTDGFTGLHERSRGYRGVLRRKHNINGRHQVNYFVYRYAKRTRYLSPGMLTTPHTHAEYYRSTTSRRRVATWGKQNIDHFVTS